MPRLGIGSEPVVARKEREIDRESQRHTESVCVRERDRERERKGERETHRCHR